MPASPRVFLDAIALFAAVWSREGGARMILKLGEAGAVRLMVSSQVLDEVEGALRRKAPEALGAFALLLDRSNIKIISSPTDEAIHDCLAITGHRGDAGVWSGFASFPIGTPGDFLAWFRTRWGEASV